MKTKLVYLFFIISLISQFNANAQNYDIPQKQLKFKSYDVADGLSQGTIYSIFQDSRGFLWFATQYGLNRYDGYSFKNYVNNPSDSLSISNNFIHPIVEDKRGYLWVGTENGLNRYDFNKDVFIRYLNDSANVHIFTSATIDKDGKIWLSTTSAGIYCFAIDSVNADKVTIINYRNDPQNNYSLNSNIVQCVFTDRKGRIWIGTDKGLNLLIDSEKGVFKKVNKIFNSDSIVESQTWMINETNSGKIFIGSTAGLFSVLEDLNNQFYLVDFFIQNKHLSIPTTVISSCRDNSNNLWLGTSTGGLFLWDDVNFRLSKIIDKMDVNSLQSGTIHSIFVDRSNVLWVGTRTGLLKFSPTNSYFENFGNTEKSNSDENLVLSFLEDRNGKFWIGKSLKMDIFDPGERKIENFDFSRFLTVMPSSYGIKSLYQDENGAIWIGTVWRAMYELVKDPKQKESYTAHQYWYYTNNNPAINDNTVFKIVEDKWNYLWLATKDGVKRFDKENKKFYDLRFTSQSNTKPPENIVYDIYKSPSNPDIIWLGTWREGMYQIQLGKNKNDIIGLRHFLPKQNDTGSISSSFVRTILEDKKGRLWAGTISEGLNLLNPDSTTFTHYNVSNGLPSNAITGILEDNSGNLWISTFSGLCRFDPETLETINFSNSDGLQNIEFNGGAYLKSSSGDLFFGGTKGFDIVHPDMVQKNKLPPPVVFTGIQLYNKSILNRVQRNQNFVNSPLVNDYGKLELNHTENVISFEFSALDYTNSNNNKYAYMMEGIDTSWNFVRARRFANYSQIPPGEYIFKVKAANNNGVWNNNGAFIKIIINPPFWQTWWFRALSILVLIALLVTLYKYRIKKIEEKKKILELQVKERTEAAQKIQEAFSEVEKLKNQLQEENIYLKDEIKLTHNFENIISTSESFKKILYRIEQVSSIDTTVLIMGESGTGKELLARAIHSLSNRKDKPLIKVNCATLPANLIESELFGHEKGSFTGAFARKIGKFEIANGGTIFLDEIGELPIELQTKLLRVLQENEFDRLGGSNLVKVDVRVIAATNRDIETALKQGTFREDLYYRLNVFPIKVPPLRDRKEDIPVLVNHFIKKHCKKVGKSIESISPGLMNKLIEYNWPGNVRELENVLERAIIISSGNSLIVEDSLIKPNEHKSTNGYQPLEEIERNYIIEVLNSTNWRVSGPKGAAKILGLVPSTLEYRMKKLNIQRL